MTWKRATHYTWRAFLTFLIVSIPGLVIQVGVTGLFAAWRWADGDPPISAALIGIFSSANALAAIWIQFSVLFVIFKYGPAAIAEVLEERRAVSDQRASLSAPALER